MALRIVLHAIHRGTSRQSSAPQGLELPSRDPLARKQTFLLRSANLVGRRGHFAGATLSGMREARLGGVWTTCQGASRLEGAGILPSGVHTSISRRQDIKRWRIHLWVEAASTHTHSTSPSEDKLEGISRRRSLHSSSSNSFNINININRSRETSTRLLSPS